MNASLAKTQSPYMRRADVVALARKAGVGKHTAAILIGPESKARKVLPGATRAVYVRRVVHELLGLTSEAS